MGPGISIFEPPEGLCLPRSVLGNAAVPQAHWLGITLLATRIPGDEE